MNPFSVLTSKIYGGVALLGMAALAYVWISGHATIASYEKAINAPVTGWQARLNACTADLATARGNAATLGSQIDRQNDAVQRLGDDAAARYANGAAERSSALEASSAAKALAAKLAKAQAGADKCASADALILETVK